VHPLLLQERNDHTSRSFGIVEVRPVTAVFEHDHVRAREGLSLPLRLFGRYE
jgi:hypothetical protein